MELRGNLKDFSLPDIIQLVGFGRKTGALRVEFGGQQSALFFEEGNVVHAEHSGASGQDAVYALFHVPEGEFRFQSEIAPPQRSIAMDPTNLIMEAARLLDESRREAPPEAEEWDAAAALQDDSWLGIEDAPAPDPQELRRSIKELLKRRFGRGAKRLFQAVDQCGDSPEDFHDLATRVEKYVHVFLDSAASGPVAQEIRTMLSPPR